MAGTGIRRSLGSFSLPGSSTFSTFVTAVLVITGVGSWDSDFSTFGVVCLFLALKSRSSQRRDTGTNRTITTVLIAKPTAQALQPSISALSETKSALVGGCLASPLAAISGSIAAGTVTEAGRTAGSLALACFALVSAVGLVVVYAT